MKNFQERLSTLNNKIYRLDWEAKIFIMKNHHKIKDWSKLSIMIYNGNTSSNKNKADHEWYRPKDLKIGKSVRTANPIYEVKNFVFDDSDGDFSLTINDKEWWWIPTESVIRIASYIEKELSNQ